MKEHLKTVVETLAPMERHLLGPGYDSALEYIKHLVPLEVLRFPSGQKLGTWTVPQEWSIKDATVTYVGPDASDPKPGPELLDFKNNPLSVAVGSRGINTRIDRETLRKHWHYSDDKPEATPYVFNFYPRTEAESWGICLPQKKLRSKIVEISADGKVLCEDGTCYPDLKDLDPSVGKVIIEGQEYQPKYADTLPEGFYDVKIDAELKDGVMKLGVHTIKGKSDREILLFAHLDHAYQANDNISGVACLLGVANKLKAEHTVKIIFCPETIGSVAYALTQDISKVDFMIAVDICGNKNSILLQKAFDEEHKINRVAHLAIQSLGETYRKGQFRNTIGSDEYVFNDPLIGIPGIMFSSWPYPEYHTSEDTVDKIDYDQIEKTINAIVRTIEYYEMDFIPKREFKGPLMRSRYGIQTPSKQVNLSWDYFVYAMDGKRTLAELCCDYGLNFEFALSVMGTMIQDGIISRIDAGQTAQQPVAKQEHASVSRKANVSKQSGKVSKGVR